jgi:hypothetical protein
MNHPTLTPSGKPFDLHERLLLFACDVVRAVEFCTSAGLYSDVATLERFEDSARSIAHPSFERMLEAWFLTVPSAVPSASAISRLL